MLPAGSLNQATLAPLGAVQTPVFGLLEEGVQVELDALGGEFGDGGVDVGDLPAEDREGEGLKVALRLNDAKHLLVRAEGVDVREAVVL